MVMSDSTTLLNDLARLVRGNRQIALDDLLVHHTLKGFCKGYIRFDGFGGSTNKLIVAFCPGLCEWFLVRLLVGAGLGARAPRKAFVIFACNLSPGPSFRVHPARCRRYSCHRSHEANLVDVGEGLLLLARM